MIQTIIGIVILLVPFLLLYKFKDKKEGFCTVLSFFLIFHLATAIITQSLGLFRYPVIFFTSMIADIFILVKINYRELKVQLKKIRIDIVLVIVVVISFLYLYQVHYNYTGTVTTINEPYREVENMKYSYPYFSDEWVAVSLIQYSISSGKLPLVNPLWHNSLFVNFELPFHSFVSEIILLLDLNPLTQYTTLTIFTGVIICLLVYLILKVNKIGNLTSGIASLSALYIVNGANLPGIWNLMPLTLGIISFLLGFVFMSLNKIKMPLVMAFLTLIFYPPLFIVYSASLIFYFVFMKTSRNKKIKSIFLYLVICAMVTLILFAFAFFVLNSLDFISKPMGSFFNYAYHHIFYQTLTKDAIPDFSIWKVIPIPVLLLSVLGIIKEAKRKGWLVAPLFTGLIFWGFYSFVTLRFIIEDARVVVFTSISIAIFSGFGLHYLINHLNKYDFIKKNKVTEIAQIIILIGFFVLSFSYTQRDNWEELKLHSLTENKTINPAAPANMYLHEDDLKLFEDIKEKNFLTVPWKGLVIGTATSNYPLLTKEATITNKLMDFNSFMNINCSRKYETAKQKKIHYVYSPEFDCKGFKIRGVSEEGLHLYEVVLDS